MPLDLARLDLLGPVASHLMALSELPKLRHLIAAARRLHVGAARVKAARLRGIRRARHIAGEPDRLSASLDNGGGNRHRREKRDRVRMERVFVKLACG